VLRLVIQFCVHTHACTCTHVHARTHMHTPAHTSHTHASRTHVQHTHHAHTRTHAHMHAADRVLVGFAAPSPGQAAAAGMAEVLRVKLPTRECSLAHCPRGLMAAGAHTLVLGTDVSAGVLPCLRGTPVHAQAHTHARVHACMCCALTEEHARGDCPPWGSVRGMWGACALGMERCRGAWRDACALMPKWRKAGGDRWLLLACRRVAPSSTCTLRPALCAWALTSTWQRWRAR